MSLWKIFGKATSQLLSSDSPVPPAVGAGNSQLAAQRANACSHTVEKGDTLWGLADRFLGDGQRWPSLHDNNAQTIGNNPDLILPGQRLDVCAADATAPAAAAGAAMAEEAQVAGVLAAVEDKLQTGLFDWAVSDDEAVDALDVLNTLPPALQKRAVEKMDKDTFDTLLSQVPLLEKQSFQALFENTTDPERKLRLWAEHHHGKVEADAELAKELTRDDGGWWPFDDTPEQEENARLNRRRQTILDSTHHEVEEEVDVALGQLAKGKLTHKDVDDIANRKQIEHELESDTFLNFTTEGEKRADGSKLFWSADELLQIKNALARVPSDHVKHNPVLHEVRRGEVAVRDGAPDPTVGADHSRDGLIRFYDTGINGSYRHTGDMPEGVGTSDGSATPLTSVEEVIVHEIGHDVHDQNEQAFQRFRTSVSWRESLGEGDLASDGVPTAEIAKLKNGYTDRVVVGGVVYRVDPYHVGEKKQPLFVSYDDGSMPARSQGATPNTTTGGDTWSYAHTNAKDHFAESYQKAVHMPETLAHDLLDVPQQRTTRALMARNTARESLERLLAQMPPASTTKIAAARAELRKQEEALTEAQSDQNAQRTQWDVLREDIFDATTVTSEAVQRLEARGVPTDRIAEFKAMAGRLQTPTQIAALEAGY